MEENLPRGIRNNNPANIRKTKNDQWQGLAPENQQIDNSFLVFKTPEYGIRALAIILNNYNKLYGINTIRGIINRFAPINENDTESYIKSVCLSVGVKDDQIINTSHKDILVPLVRAIIRHENGFNPYKDDVILNGIKLAVGIINE